MDTDNNFSQSGTSKGMRTIITIGEVKGIMEHQKEMGPCGLFTADIPT